MKYGYDEEEDLEFFEPLEWVPPTWLTEIVCDEDYIAKIHRGPLMNLKHDTGLRIIRRLEGE